MQPADQVELVRAIGGGERVFNELRAAKLLTGFAGLLKPEKGRTMNKQDQGLLIAGKTYSSRLLVGSGKYKDLDQTREATEASGANIITVAIRRVNIGQDPNAPSLLDAVPPSKYTILPNTAGCYNAEDAVYTLQLARELLDGHKLVKLEVLGDEKTLFPNMPETLKAAEILVKDGFDVMVLLQ